MSTNDTQVYVLVVSFGLIPEVEGVFVDEDDAQQAFVEACRDVALYESNIYKGSDGRYYCYVDPMVDGRKTKKYVNQEDVDRAIDEALATWPWDEWDATAPENASFATTDNDNWEIRLLTAPFKARVPTT